MEMRYRRGRFRCCRRRVGRTGDRAIVLHPLGDAAEVIADVLVSQFAKQADRLRCEWSGRPTAVDSDLTGQVRQHLAGAPGDLCTWQVDRAGDVPLREGRGRQHIDDDQGRIL